MKELQESIKLAVEELRAAAISLDNCGRWQEARNAEVRAYELENALGSIPVSAFRTS